MVRSFVGVERRHCVALNAWRGVKGYDFSHLESRLLLICWAYRVAYDGYIVSIYIDNYVLRLVMVVSAICGISKCKKGGLQEGLG